MIRLFIENREIELTDDVQFAITSQFENLSNPTDIINDWSKTVSIPFTHKNDVTFGHIYCPDKSIVDGGTVGVYFNPLKKLNFRLIWNDNIVMMGYAKLNQVKQNSGKGTYEVTLFGELGKVFQEMKKITFDTSTVDTNYLIDGSEYVDEYINKELVYKSWTSTGQSTDRLYPKYIHGNIPNTSYKVTDIIGFAPNNSFSEGFDYKAYQYQNSGSKSFTETLGSGFTQDTRVEPETAIPNGLLPREIGEYRSYYQLPFIYWNKLFKIFQSKAQTITGYQFDLDSTWFNTNNPYWYNLVYMLKPFDVKDGTMTDNANTYVTKPYSSMGWQASSSINTMTTHRTTNLVTYNNEWTETVPMVDSSVTFSDGKWFTLDDNTLYPVFKLHSEWYFYDGDGSSSSSQLNTNNALVLNVNAVGENGTTKTIKYLIKRTACTLTETGATVINFDGSTLAGTSDVLSIDTEFIVNKKTFGNSVRFRYEGYWKNSNWSLTSNGDLVYFSPNEIGGTTHSNVSVTILDGVHRSFGYFTLNDLWNNDYNLFSEIIKYCKIYRISISVDEFNKKIKFKRYQTLFSDYSIKNWTNMVDKSKDFDIKPVTFENKYVLFNYKDVDSKLAKEYKEKYGINYGEYRLVTDYNFNSETTKLFEEVTPSIVNTDNVLSWTNLCDYHKIAYSFPSEIYVYNKDKDKKQVDVFGAYYFHNGKANFSTEASLHLRDVVISDDTAFQQGNNTYFYTQDSDITKSVTTYPKLDVIKGDDMCVFNTPKENYTYLDNYSGKNTIYSKFWENYINERYNVQNKKITCYIKLKPTEYCQFEWNNLKLIGNQLYIVNKIYDYNITNTDTTKVDLITIQNLSGYTQ